MKKQNTAVQRKCYLEHVMYTRVKPVLDDGRNGQADSEICWLNLFWKSGKMDCISPALFIRKGK